MYIKCIYMTIILHRGVSHHAVGEAFYTGELEHEIREVSLVDFRFKKDSDREKFRNLLLSYESAYVSSPGISKLLSLLNDYGL